MMGTMESSSVLVALEELEKWRTRKNRLEKELRELRQRRTQLHAELERAKREVAALKDVLFEPREPSSTAYRQPPFQQG